MFSCRQEHSDNILGNYNQETTKNERIEFSPLPSTTSVRQLRKTYYSPLSRIPFVQYARTARSDLPERIRDITVCGGSLFLGTCRFPRGGQPTEAALSFKIVHVLRVDLARRLLGHDRCAKRFAPERL